MGADDEKIGWRFGLVLATWDVIEAGARAVWRLHIGRCKVCGAPRESERFRRFGVCSRKCRRALESRA